MMFAAQPVDYSQHTVSQKNGHCWIQPKNCLVVESDDAIDSADVSIHHLRARSRLDYFSIKTGETEKQQAWRKV